MKSPLIILFLSFSLTLFAQENTKNGVAAEGYDVVSYFSNSPAKGENKIQSEYDGVIYQFSSTENQELFTNNPEKYLPAYGGWCAYAMGTTGEKVSINPETYEIRDGRLYLFYNKLFTNTLKSWLDESPENLIPVADENWGKIKK